MSISEKIVRPGGQIISQYYTFLRLGREGYRKIQQECYDTARFLAQAIDQMGILTKHPVSIPLSKAEAGSYNHNG